MGRGTPECPSLTAGVPGDAGVIGGVVRCPVIVLQIAHRRVCLRRAVWHVVKSRVAAPRDLTKGHPGGVASVPNPRACVGP